MDSSGHTTILPNCPDCGTPVGERHKPGCDVGRCRACGIDMGHPVWTGEYPVCVTRSDLIGYGLVLHFYREDGHLCGNKHRRHDELVAEFVTTLDPDRCSLDSVQGDNDVTSYIFFVEPCGDVPTPDHFTGLGEKYGPSQGWLTTHYDGDKHETIRFDVDGDPTTSQSQDAPIPSPTTMKTERDPLDDLDFNWQRNDNFEDEVIWHEARGNYCWQINVVLGQAEFHYLVRDIHDQTWVDGMAATFEDAEEQIHEFLVAR